ncbi:MULTISPECIES: terminase large subunit domain-containing protein [Sphingomonas]|uniref:terminase large subunit domain-containing protein n=1 Tax=Sphingomonas TaxID=13687 RepID=UPI000DEF77E9|nr:MULTISPECIES: terminase family protein [Sphingomonas]
MRHGEFPALVAGLSHAEVLALLGTLDPSELAAIADDWRLWARPEQVSPAGAWETWVVMAGRGFGKTRAGAEWIAEQVRARSDLRIALVAATYAEARDVMVEGDSGLRAVADPLIGRFYPARRLIKFHNGSEARLYSGASPDELRGPQHHFAWCDELAKWKKSHETWSTLQLGLRLGHRPQVMVTTTPRARTVLAQLLEREGTVHTGGSTAANRHLPLAFRTAMERQYGGTSLGRQELEGELVTDVAGALWTAALIKRCRWPGGVPLPGFARIVIGVDPPSGGGTCGIVACALDREGRGHVLADHSVTAATPEQWAARVAEAAALHGPRSSEGRALVVAEQNQGGKMVLSVLHGAAPDLHVRLVTARVGKSHRAEPIALRFENGSAFFHGRFGPLEGQLMGLIAGGGYDGPGTSPDRADAMVWALTELLLAPKRAKPGIGSL